MIPVTNPLIEAILAYNQLSDDQILQLTHPFELKPSQNELFSLAKEMILTAIQNKKKIIICGDYDCDGLCGTSILVLTLRKLGADVGFYIPNRFEDGYGLHPNTVKKALDKGYELFITVDNGVSAFEALDLIKQHQAQVIVVDHHEITASVDANILLHPMLLEEGHTNLCGSGLAHQLSHHLIGYDPYITALAGTATIADMMPLWDYNRVLVTTALQEINHHLFAQFKTLLKPDIQSINEEILAFQVIPKINAVGRLADLANVNRVVDFLCSELREQIESLSIQIQAINEQRKVINQTMYAKALTMIEDTKVLILKDESFHEGVVGITAGRLANEFKRPAIVMHDNGQRLKGSARSYGDIDLRALLEIGLPYLNRYGGHAAAAGLELDVSNFAQFKSLINGQVFDIEAHSLIPKSLPFKSDLITVDNFKALKTLAPFGMGFEIPLFEVSGIQCISSRIIKGGKMAQLSINGEKYNSVYFSQNVETNDICDPDKTLFCRLSLDEYALNTKLKLLIERVI